MKRSILVLVIAIVVAFAGSAMAQAPAGGGQGRGGGGGGGRGGGGRGGPPAPPALTGPLADAVNGLITALNKQDAAYLQKAVASDALWLDEDGHMFPANVWIGRLMQGMPRMTAITNLTGQMWETAGWVAFRYTLDETTAQGPNKMQGTGSLTFKKVGNDWQVAVIHAPVDGRAITPH